MPPDTTVLRLTGVGVPPYSARGLTQTLDPVPQSIQLARTVNGGLEDISDPLMRKYMSTITGSDQQPPALEATWPGASLLVDCIVELAVEGIVEGTTEPPTEDPTEGLFGRAYVPGSVRHENGFTFYRPRLVMLVTGFTMSAREWEAGVDWTLSLEER